MHLTEHHYLTGDAPAGAHGPHHHHVLAAASGGWWGGPHDGRGIPSADSPDGNPNGYHVLAVDGAQYTTRFVPAAGKTSGQLARGRGWPLGAADARDPRRRRPWRILQRADRSQ